MIDYNRDKDTDLSELRDRVGWDDGIQAGMEKTTVAVMLLCDRLQAALDRIAELEARVADCEASFTRHRQVGHE